MADIKIAKDMNIVKIMAAQARKESVDSNLAKEAADLIKELSSDLSPQNKYAIAQLVGFTVNEIIRPHADWMDLVADVKHVGYGERAQFKTRLEGVRAFVQAKGATTARSKVANKTVTLDTLAISARPVINIVELQTGQVNMADLINDAAYQMELKQYELVQNTLATNAATWANPYYGTGSGIVKATLDPMIRFWMRASAGSVPAIMGDIAVISKLAEQTGFTVANNTLQFADPLMVEFNNAGFIGKYNGANVINMVNPLKDGSDNFLLDQNKLYILPAGVDAAMRPLKVVFEGDVQSQEATNIDDKSYEVRLDQYMGAGIVYGDRPYMSIYEDSSI